ncbi:MAG TPA: hypothetical protein VN600_10160 [Gemmatimonadaceae bacterium]|nr:hypothetical protein [Gemmatimonadaceae bacterium]
MARRTPIQLAFLAVGLIAWAYGQRTEDQRLVWLGIAFLIVATLLRFARRREADRH